LSKNEQKDNEISFCEVIVNFDFNDIKILKQKIALDNVVFFTNDPNTLEKILGLGYNITNIMDHLGLYNEKVDLVNDESIKKLQLLNEFMKNGILTEYNLVDDLGFFHLQRLIFLERVRKILQDNKNVIFLFNNFSFHYFAILDIAYELGYQKKFGVASFSKSNLKTLNFDETRTNKIDLIRKNLATAEKISDDKEVDSFAARMPEIRIGEKKPKYAFFLINNETDFYLKPVYPILKKFDEFETDYIIFTFDSRTKFQLSERGFNSHDLSDYIDDLSISSYKIKKVRYDEMLHLLKRKTRYDRKLHLLKRKSLKLKRRILYLYFFRLQYYGIIRWLVTRPIIKPKLLKMANMIEDDFSIDIPEKEMKIIVDHINEAKSLKTNEHVLKSYLKYFDDDYLVNNVGKILAINTIVDKIFSKFNFKSVFVAVDASPANNVVCNLANKYKIPSYSIPQIFIRINKIPVVLPLASRILIAGSRIKDELLRFGMNEDRVLITGSPRYDLEQNSESSRGFFNKMKQVFHKKIIKTSTKLIIVAMSRWSENDEKWISELIHFCNENNIDILIKIHPMYLSPINYKVSQEKIKKISKICLGLKYNMSYDVNLAELWPVTDILITEHSIVGVEAAFRGVPIIVADMNSEEKVEESMEFEREGIALHATSMGELSDCIKKIFYDKKTKEKLQNAIKKFCYEYNYLNDGKAAERIYGLMTKNNELLNPEKETS